MTQCTGMPARRNSHAPVERKVLGLDVQHLTPTVHPVGGIDAVRHKGRPVGRIFRELGRLETVRPAALGAALLGLFAFGIGHDSAELPASII